MWVAPRRPWALAWVLAAAAIGLLAAGLGVTRQVKEKREGRRTRTPRMETVTELQLIEDATFSGVVRREGLLESTYDRTRPQLGKQSCPT